MRDVKYFIGSNELSIFYPNKDITVPTLPIVVNPGQIMPLRLTTPFDAKYIYSFMDPSWRGKFAPPNMSSGPRRTAPIGLWVDSMKSNGEAFSKGVIFSNVTISDNTAKGYGYDHIYKNTNGTEIF